MKTTLLLLSIIMASAPAFAAQPGQCGAGFDTWDLNCDGKIDGDEASASMQPFYDQQKRVSRPAHREGLPPPSEAGYPKYAVSNEMGTWKRVSTNLTDIVNAGAYSQLLTPDAEGQACYKGTKGLILGTERECTNWNSGGWHCEGYGPETVSSSSGYKAECQ